MNDMPVTSSSKFYIVFILLFVGGLFLSAIHPHDYFTWFLEVVPAIIGLVILLFTRKKFPLSGLLYCLILFHAYVLFAGGHYTYARVPLFDWLKDVLHQSRNNYDKLGHFTQGFVPAILARELLIRKHVVAKPGWLFFICTAICLAFSAFYELVEAFVAIATGDSAESFLGTQGYVWDTQSDMCWALIGAVVALVLLPGVHDKYLNRLSVNEVQAN